MRVRVVTRISLGLVALFLLCAALFAWLRTARTGTAHPIPDAAAAALFERHCGACHTAEALRPALGSPSDRQVRLRELAVFLQDHAGAAPEEDLLILDYLGGATRRD